MNDEDNNNKYNKYLLGLTIYLVACYGMYEIKKERAIAITHDEVMMGIKKGEIRLITVVKVKNREK